MMMEQIVQKKNVSRASGKQGNVLMRDVVAME
jgi:hypothetical protein